MNEVVKKYKNNFRQSIYEGNELKYLISFTKLKEYMNENELSDYLQKLTNEVMKERTESNKK